LMYVMHYTLSLKLTLHDFFLNVKRNDQKIKKQRKRFPYVLI
ncbi:hypothetical protein HMPREF1987_00794, partial [Peptostreptococcaceae bacterium oral taxon 113 str. W5053]